MKSPVIMRSIIAQFLKCKATCILIRISYTVKLVGRGKNGRIFRIEKAVDSALQVMTRHSKVLHSHAFLYNIKCFLRSSRRAQTTAA